MRAAVLALLIAAAGCAGRSAVQRPHPAPSADALLKSLRARQSALRTLNVETTTTSWLGGERVRASVIMLVDRAGKLRFSAETRLSGTVAELAVDGKAFALIDYEQKLFRTGGACPENVAALIRIPLLPAEVAAILLGDAPVDELTRAVAVEWDARRGVDVLALERAVDGAASSRLWVGLKPTSAGGYDVVSVEGQNGRDTRRWRVEYDDRERVVGGHALPSTIRFAEPGRSFDDGVEIKVKTGDRRVNPPLAPELFTLEAPAGFTLETLRCPPAR